MSAKFAVKILENAELEETVTTEKETKLGKDSGWAWVVCLAAAVVQFVVFGIHNSFGILYIVFVREYQWSKALTGYIGSMGLGMNFFFGPITSALCHRFGCRKVAMSGGLISSAAMFATSFADSLIPIYLSYSVLWGLGSSLCYVPTFLMIDMYFDRHKSLANGLITAGSAIGALVMGPTLNVLLESFGWRKTMRFLGGCTFILFVAALTYRAPPLKRSRGLEFEVTKKKLIDFSVWRNKDFVVWALALGVFNLGYFVPFVYLPTHATSQNIPESKASFLIGFLSVGSLLGRLLFGRISDFDFVNRLYLYQTALLIMAVTTTLLPLATTYTVLILYTLLFGVFDGAFVALIAVLTTDIVGSDMLPSALGFLYFVISVPTMTGSLIAGFLSDVTSTYHEAFYFSGATIAICACALSLIPPPMKARLPAGTKATPDEFGEEKWRQSFLKKFVCKHFIVLDKKCSEHEKFLVDVDRETDV